MGGRKSSFTVFMQGAGLRMRLDYCVVSFRLYPCNQNPGTRLERIYDAPPPPLPKCLGPIMAILRLHVQGNVHYDKRSINWQKATPLGG